MQPKKVNSQILGVYVYTEIMLYMNQPQADQLDNKIPACFVW